MKFALFIVGGESAWASLPKAEQDRTVARYGELGKKMTAKNALVDAHRLRPSAEAKIVRIDGNHKIIASDGVAASSLNSSAVGGFYLINAASFDEAMGWAREMAEFSHSAIEVRQVWE